MVREQANMNYQYGWSEDRFKAQSGRSRPAGRACGNEFTSRNAPQRRQIGQRTAESKINGVGVPGRTIERQPISLSRLLTEPRFFSEADRRAIWLAIGTIAALVVIGYVRVFHSHPSDHCFGIGSSRVLAEKRN
jgi:hypothetical protein